ncbi:MAG TPA: chorismate mutase [Microbacteriaceae bacterium]
MALHDNPSSRAGANDTEAALAELHSIRESIDNIDAALVHMLAERFKFTQFVGTLKAEHGLPPADPEREREQIQRLRRLAEASHLDPEFAEKWFNFVVAEVIHHHVEAAERTVGGNPA